MNFFIFISALITFVAIIGHFTMGRKAYLKPVMDSDIEQVPKKVMQSVFHYMSVFLVLSLFILLAGSHRSCPMYDYVHTMIHWNGLWPVCHHAVRDCIDLRNPRGRFQDVPMGILGPDLGLCHYRHPIDQ